jgi:hypothetical protein
MLLKKEKETFQNPQLIFLRLDRGRYGFCNCHSAPFVGRRWKEDQYY